MKGFGTLTGALAGAALFTSTVLALDPIIIKGKSFFYSTSKEEFFIRGVAYQQGYVSNGSVPVNAKYNDPLDDINDCNRDIPYLKRLSTNVIRTYAVDPTKDHSACMAALDKAGIYVISDLSSPQQSVNRDDPQWNTDLFDRYKALIDNLGQYSNVIGFFAGNEVTNSFNTSAASAFVKAAVRDSKAYIKQTVSRPLYVGYATYDGQVRNGIADYFNCGDQDEAIDFLGYNIYSWCGAQSSYTISGYDTRTDFFRPYSIPVFFAEYGCNVPEPRVFDEVDALYGNLMTPVWSGGIVYMYFQEANNYGLVTISGGTVSPKQPDFDNLSKKLDGISPSSTAYNSEETNLSPARCPAVGAVWSAAATPLPPTPNEELCQCLQSTLQCVVKPSVPEKAYGDDFGYVCGKNPSACIGIIHDATTGNYGDFGACSPDIQLSYVYNKYYQAQGAQDYACDFNGHASIQAAAASPTGKCASLLQAAGTNGGGLPAGATPSVSGSGNPDAAPQSVSVPFHLYLYGAIAVLTGVGMILL